MKIFVVSLERSVKRRDRITEMLSNKNIDFEFFNAVDGREEKHQFFDNYNNSKRLKRKGYSLSPGEMGCFTSHYLLWEKCVELNQPIVILEDDVVVHDNFKEIINDIITESERYGLIRLVSSLSDDLIITSEIFSNFRIVGYKKPVLGTQGYVISPESAKKLIEASKEWYEPVDDFIDNEWRHKAGVYCALPSCITHIDEESDIGDRGKPKISIIKRLRRETYRTIEQVRLYIYLTLKK